MREAKGEYKSLEIVRETIPDGQGGEVDGITIRLWQFGEEEGDEILGCTLQMGDDSGPIPPVWDLIESFLRVVEIEQY